MSYTPDSIWRNRDHFLQGRDSIAAFLRKKWASEKEYRLRKELFAFTDNKVQLHTAPLIRHPLVKRARLANRPVFPDCCAVLV